MFYENLKFPKIGRWKYHKGKNEENLTNLSSFKYNLIYLRLDSAIPSFRRPPKYYCRMKLVTGPSSVVPQSPVQTFIILYYSHIPGSAFPKEGHNTQCSEIFFASMSTLSTPAMCLSIVLRYKCKFNLQKYFYG